MAKSEKYVPPKKWVWDKENGGKFANINRPISGNTHVKDLPVGKHPFQLYSQGTPNGVKITIMLEELLDLGIKEAEYDAWLIRIGNGDQFSSGFVEINPNSKIPSLLDKSRDQPVRIFESGSILLYLADKFDIFIPKKCHMIKSIRFNFCNSAKIVGSASSIRIVTCSVYIFIFAITINYKPIR